MTRRSRYSVLLLIVLIALPLTAAPVAAATGPLDGKTFAGETGEKGKSTGEKEEFSFANGSFDPLSCHQFGFTSAPYTATTKGKEVQFTAKTTSPKEGVMKWTGTVNGDQLEGTVVWVKEGRSIDYWFKGKLKP